MSYGDTPHDPTKWSPGAQVLVQLENLWIGPFTLVNGYRPGLWQVRDERGAEFVISTHVLRLVP